MFICQNHNILYEIPKNDFWLLIQSISIGLSNISKTEEKKKRLQKINPARIMEELINDLIDSRSVTTSGRFCDRKKGVERKSGQDI